MAQDVSGLAASLQLDASTTAPRSHSSLGRGRKSPGVYRPPRPSSLAGGDAVGSVSSQQSISYSVSRASLGGGGGGGGGGGAAGGRVQNYHSRFTKVGANAPEPSAAAAADRHPCALPRRIPVGPMASIQLTRGSAGARSVTPATSPDGSAEEAEVDAAMELTAAEQRQAKRERLRSEHEKTQLQLMRLLDQIREVPTHSPRAHLAELALTAARARRTPRPISSII